MVCITDPHETGGFLHKEQVTQKTFFYDDVIMARDPTYPGSYQSVQLMAFLTFKLFEICYLPLPNVLVLISARSCPTLIA